MTAFTLVPSAPVEVKLGDKLVPARMVGMSTRDKGRAVLVEIYFHDGRSSLVPWKDVSTNDKIGAFLLGPEISTTKK